MSTAWVEIKLFLREPVTVLFTLALPLLVLFVLNGVFGNTPDPQGRVYGGIGPATFYTPAYVGLVVASMGLIGLPPHLAGYRERGVLRRFRASTLPSWSLPAAQVVVTLVLSVTGGVMVVVASRLLNDVPWPSHPGALLLAFVCAVAAFSAIGLLLAAVLPTARAAQGAGILLWFVMMLLCGTGPPREVLSSALRGISSVLPLTPVVRALQSPWFGSGTSWVQVAWCLAITAVCGGLALRFFRWD